MFESFTDAPIFPLSMNVPEEISINNICISYEKTYDEYGNLSELKWKSGTRADIKISSAIILPIFRGSFMFDSSTNIESTPNSMSGYAYDVELSKCWEFDGDKWVEQNCIVSPSVSDTVVKFGSKDSSTRIQIVNFRGDVVYEATENGLTMNLEIDDELAQVLHPGGYHINVFNINNDIVTPISRVALSILE